MKTKRQLNVPQNEFEETIINYIESLQMEPKMIDLIMIMMERLLKAKKKDIDKGRQTQKAYLSELDAKEAEIHNCIPHIAKYENLLE